MKKVFKIFIYYLPVVAIFFAFYKFLNLEKIELIEIEHPLYLVLSILLLLLVFFSRIWIWKRFLDRFNFKINIFLVGYSEFKTVFTKYIPGKIWTFLSATSIIANEGYSFKKVFSLSVLYQIIGILSGLSVGMIGLIFYKIIFLNKVLWVLVILINVFFLVLFSFKIRIPEFSGKGYLTKRIKALSGIEVPRIVDLYLYLGLHWLLLGVSYYFFFKATVPDISLSVIFVQNIANNMGVLAFFAPGGMGVREGFMILYLNKSGLDVNLASQLSVYSRLWFILVEIILFIISFFLIKRYRRKTTP